MLSCREVMRQVSSDDFSEAGWWQVAALRFHLMMCRHCRAYVRQLRAISEAARKAWGTRGQDDSALQSLKQRILQGHPSEKVAQQAKDDS